MLSSVLLPSGLCVLSAFFTPARAQFQWQFNTSVRSNNSLAMNKNLLSMALLRPVGYFHVIGNMRVTTDHCEAVQHYA